MRRGSLCIAALALAAAACQNDMYQQPKYRPLTESTFYSDGRSSRDLPEDTVARGGLRGDDLLYSGKVGGADSGVLPFPVTGPLLDRGQQRYDIFCSPCHGRLGDGEGMIVQRGMKHPPSFHDERLRQMPPGHFFDVITNGYGVMYPYNTRITPEDRWAIIAYIRALQLSQNATAADAPEQARAKLLEEKK